MNAASPAEWVCPISYDGKPDSRSFWTGNLPHWDVFGRPIFLTLHVRDAIPPEASQRIREQAAAVKSDRDTAYTRRLRLIFAEMEKWLDHGDHETALSRPAVAEVLREAIAERQKRQWWSVLHWVAMPSHLHVLYVGGTVGMKTLMTDFKRWTGHQAAKVLGRETRRFWQDEWFDHWSRSADETDRIAAYIRQNPVRAGLSKTPEDWPHASWSKCASDRSPL
jgi:putative transposase